MIRPKKALALLLAGVCVMTSLTACGGAGNTNDTSAGVPDSSEPTEITSVPGIDTTDQVDTTSEPETTEAFNFINAPLENCLYSKENAYYTITPDGGELFVDHETDSHARRGGHFGHAMVEYEDGKILDFYPNCNTDNNGHSGRGWMEYKRSTDYGETWSEAKRLEYSYNTFVTSNNKRSIICEKAVLAPDGSIVLFCLNCDVDENALWEPYYEPTVIRSTDGGETWSEPVQFSKYRGRVYDSMVVDGVIYALMKHSNNESNNDYYLYSSTDNGLTFKLRSEVPIERAGSFYGTLGILADGRFIVYTYNPSNEYKLEYCTSSNRGKSWNPSLYTDFAKGIRNPQLVRLGDAWFIFGRSDMNTGNIVLYCSSNGIKWDEGRYLKERVAGIGAYSNTLVVGTFNPNVPDRVLYQSSFAYRQNLTNVYHWWLDMYLAPEES